MAEIILTQGKVTIVDAEDFGRINQYKWCVICNYGNWYAVRTIKKSNGKRTNQYMHRFVMNIPKGMDTDHRNHDTLDNRKSNLRICTHAENIMNQLPQRRETTSKHKGVHWDKRAKRWQARIQLDGKQMHIGCYTNETIAALAYDRKAKELFGDFAYLNFGDR